MQYKYKEIHDHVHDLTHKLVTLWMNYMNNRQVYP